MKKEFAALFFYMLYMIAMMRPVMPILEYYANYDYIATVLCENRDKPAMACNGKCYLQKEMEKVSQSDIHTNHKQHSSVPQIDLTKYPVAPIVVVDNPILIFDTLLDQNWDPLYGKPIATIVLVYRPPLFIS